jgi:hypothetical protein
MEMGDDDDDAFLCSAVILKSTNSGATSERSKEV